VKAPAPRAVAELVRLPAVLSVPGDVLVGAAASGQVRDVPRAAGVSFSARSYAHTVPASGASTFSARAPSDATASPAEAAVRPPASPSANPGVTRPEGIGRDGRSTASTSRSA